MAKSLYLKLGIKEHFKLAVINPPTIFPQLFTDVPLDLHWSEEVDQADYIHFFPNNVQDLEDQLLVLQDMIHKDGMIWVSWFKKASKIPTDINEDIIRDTALAMKLVDVKVCSVNDQYSGLKLVIRKHLR